MVTLTVEGYDEWREAARRLLAASTPPEAVAWLGDATTALPFTEPHVLSAHSDSSSLPKVPRAFVRLAEMVALHRSERKWNVLYRLLWRLTHGERDVLARESDEDVRRAMDMNAQVRRDEHKMRALVRFTPVTTGEGTRYVAWYEPDHLIVRLAAPLFADRFSGMRWSILTPDLSAHWDGVALTFSDGVALPMRPGAADAVEDLWRSYYAATFNAARVNPRAMLREMPLRRWRHLPEATMIPHLVSTANERTTQVLKERSGLTAKPFVPLAAGIDELQRAAPSCRGCPLHLPATQVVFGEGPHTAGLVLVGEQPGDAEDLAGRPFVGPAGQVLDRALAAARIARETIYLTNAVKHFSFEPRGKRRIHQTPRLSELQACRPWLEAELQAIRPATVVALGSSAARTLMGPQARVMSMRGRVIEGLAWAPRVVVTIHPSAVLRSEDEGERYFAVLVEDLTLAAGRQ